MRSRRGIVVVALAAGLVLVLALASLAITRGALGEWRAAGGADDGQASPSSSSPSSPSSSASQSQAVLARTFDNRASGLRTFEVGSGTTPVVLLHGYGATPQEWLPFAHTIVVSADRRFVFPQAPEETMPPDGPVGGRAWWRLGLASYRSAATQGLPDMSRDRPEGLERAAHAIQALLGDLRARLDHRPERAIVGGFSQGAMIVAELAFRSSEPLEALVLLSGTPVDEQSWLQGMRLRRGLPVFISHGRHDDVLPFSGSARLQQTMRDAGLRVTWVPFEGGHETPAEVVVALNQFLATVEAGRAEPLTPALSP